MKSKQYNIRSFRDIRSRFRAPRFVGLFTCWNAIIKSAKESKVNYFFQFVNLVLVVFLMVVVLPDFFDQQLSSFSFGKFEWGFLPIGRFVVILISYIIFKSISWFFSFPLSDIFMTTLSMTLWIMVGLLVLVVSIYNKLILALLGRLKQDLIL